MALIRVWHVLNVSTSSCDCLKLLYLKNTTTVHTLDVSLAPLTKLFEFFIDIEKQLFNLTASIHVLGIEAGADAKMQWLFRLLLFGSLFEA